MTEAFGSAEGCWNIRRAAATRCAAGGQADVEADADATGLAVAECVTTATGDAGWEWWRTAVALGAGATGPTGPVAVGVGETLGTCNDGEAFATTELFPLPPPELIAAVTAAPAAAITPATASPMIVRR